MGIYERINAGEYENKLPYPTKSKASKESGEWLKAHAAYRAESARLLDLFCADLCNDFGVPKDDPFVQEMFRRAWQQGHANGFSEVAGEFSELMPLWEMYESKGVA